jgi:ABC-2 type transport system ATP-binding protein
MTPTIRAAALGRRYRDQVALDDVSLGVAPGTVTGLLGRNGAGKTTLMRIITGLEFPTSGGVRVFGEIPAENDAVLRRIVFVREEQPYPDFRVRHAIKVASWCYPNWSRSWRASWSPTSACRRTGGSAGCRAACGPRSGSSSGWRPAPS